MNCILLESEPYTFWSIVNPVTAVRVPPAQSPALPSFADVPVQLVVAARVAEVVGELPAHARGAVGGPGGGQGAHTYLCTRGRSGHR